MRLNISQIVPRIAKRVRVSGAAGITLSIIALFTSNIYAQNTGTPSQLRVKVDANNYLILVAAAQTLPISSPTVFTNIRLKTDSANQLYVVVTGNITPTTITCSSSVGTTSTVLVGGTPCSWSSTPGIVGRSATTSFYWENPSFTNTAGCPNCGYPSSAFGIFGAYDATAGGMEFRSVANTITNPSMRFVTIDGQQGGVGNQITSPIFQFTVASGQSGGGVTGSNGYLYQFNNLGKTDLSRWCFTTEIAIASCTTDWGGGTPDRYLFDWSLDSNSLMQLSRLNIKSTTTFGGNIIALTDNSFDIGASGATRPRTGYFGTSIVTPTVNATTALQQNGVAAALAVASGYKIARGSIALDGSNPTTVATGLSTVVSCTSDLRRTTALGTGTAFLTHDTPSGANVDFYGWILAGTASTGTETFEWICVGT